MQWRADQTADLCRFREFRAPELLSEIEINAQMRGAKSPRRRTRSPESEPGSDPNEKPIEALGSKGVVENEIREGGA